MAQFMSRWFTAPSKKSSGTPSSQSQSNSLTQSSEVMGGLDTTKRKKKTQTRYAGLAPIGSAEEANVARKTLLGQ